MCSIQLNLKIIKYLKIIKGKFLLELWIKIFPKIVDKLRKYNDILK